MNIIAPKCANIQFCKVFNKTNQQNKLKTQKQTISPKTTPKQKIKPENTFKFLLGLSISVLGILSILKCQKTFSINKKASEILLSASKKYDEVSNIFENMKSNNANNDSLKNVSLYNFKKENSTKTTLFENLNNGFSRISVFIDEKLSTIEEFSGKNEKNKYFFNPETGLLEKFYKNFQMDNDIKTIAPEIFYFKDNKLSSHVKNKIN